MSGKPAPVTYSLLGPRTTPPSEYEVVTSRLHYYVGRGFETDVPLRHWYERYQEQSPLQCADWEIFADPDVITYPKYTRTRKAAELELDRIAAAQEEAGPQALPGGWGASIDALLPPLRFALHGLHMIASYVGHMAPSGRITLTALFQSADELRRIERIACGMCLLHGPRARDLDAESRRRWQTAQEWQPLREATERLLVTYDWGEALIGLNLCLKPVVDEIAAGGLLDEARRRGDAYWTAVLESAHGDCLWQRRWTVALVRVAVAQNPANREVIGRWLELWGPRALLAVEALAGLLPDGAAAVRRAHTLHAELVASALSPRDGAGT